MKPVVYHLSAIALALTAVSSCSLRHSADSELFYAYEDAHRAAIEDGLRARLSPSDSEEKVERVLKSMNLAWAYGPAGDGIHCLYSARRDLRGRAFLGVEVWVALEGGAWHFTRFKVTPHHPFI